MTPLAGRRRHRPAGAAWVEKEATYVNDHGLLQATARVMAPPGDAHEDWRVLADVATAAGITTSYADARAVRAAIAAPLGGAPAFSGITEVTVPEADWPRRPGCRRRTLRNAGSGITCSRISRR